MDPRLDPACTSAQALVELHRRQESLLVAGSDGRLAALVRAKHGRQLREHRGLCMRCRAFEPTCDACGCELLRARHGWLCPRQGSRWRDIFPWNWRARRPAPGRAGPRTAASGSARGGGHPPGTPPGRAHPPGTPPGSAPRPSPPPAFAGPRGVPPPPQRPSARSAARSSARARSGGGPVVATPSDDLAAAYRVLGLSPRATRDAVRMAFRVRALECHPDRVAHLAPEFRAVAERKMREVNAAFERIKGSW